MSTISENYTEGYTGDIIYQLLDNGLPFDATGMSIDIVLKDQAGLTVDVVGDVSWETAALSKPKYIPDPTDFVAARSPYTAHWKVTNGTKVLFYPQGAPIVWRVHKQ